MINLFVNFKKVHFIGIGGIGMSGIAELINSMGLEVSGSDEKESSTIDNLRSLGIRIAIGHKKENVADSDLIVYSSAVKQNNVELQAAYDMQIQTIKRGEMLGEITRLTYTIGVAGSHGKTTTSSMLGETLRVVGGKYNPTLITGGRLNRTNSNINFGNRSLLVSEMDESDRSFLLSYPTASIVTNIDYEHADEYGSLDEIKQVFLEFMNKTPFYGFNVICIDDENLIDLLPKLKRRSVTYGFSDQADVQGIIIDSIMFSSNFQVLYRRVYLGDIHLSVPGEHNILNSLSVVATCLEIGIPFNEIKKGLEGFEGTQRRLSIRYQSEDIILFDDYGHHPTEIQTTLNSVKKSFPNYEITVIFQPHRYSRVQCFFDDFAKCFHNSQSLYILDVYSAGEEKIKGFESTNLSDKIKSYGYKNIEYVPDTNQESRLISILDGICSKKAGSKEIIITFGAGSITNISMMLADYLKGERK